ncbi:MAG: caspase family protein [Labilithrix sp.]|nr:caspase family protein [Labilithrix sp.]
MNYAVLVGINAYKQVTGLNGCINDIEDVAKRLSATNSVPESNITKLIDSGATKAAVVSAIKDMLAKLKFGERAYIHFSGHGVQLPSTDPGELDGLDEVLCAHDFDWTAATAVADDELYRLLLERAPGSEVLVTLDCCHSGDQLKVPLARGLSAVRTLPAPPKVRAEILLQKGAVRTFRSLALAGSRSCPRARHGSSRSTRRSRGAPTAPSRTTPCVSNRQRRQQLSRRSALPSNRTSSATA